MTCERCGKKIENPDMSLAIGATGVVCGGMAVETAIVAGMLFTPLALIAVLTAIAYMTTGQDVCQCAA